MFLTTRICCSRKGLATGQFLTTRNLVMYTVPYTQGGDDAILPQLRIDNPGLRWAVVRLIDNLNVFPRGGTKYYKAGVFPG